MTTTKTKGKEKTKELIEKLKQGINDVQSSKEFRRILKAMSMFHRYSWCNCLLIALQMPSATRVAGYKTWQKLGRQVKKGEKGIAIFAPMSVKRKDETLEEDKEDEDEYFLIFRVVHVFDVSQTEGEPLPELHSLNLRDSHKGMLRTLLKYCDNKQPPIKVRFVPLSNCYGYSTLGEVIIDENRNPTEQAVVLIHEIAHELIHHTKTIRKELTEEQKEMEAEATAFVVCNNIGLPEVGSERYLSLYHRSYDLQQSLEAIHRAAGEILNAIYPEEGGEKECAPSDARDAVKQ